MSTLEDVNEAVEGLSLQETSTKRLRRSGRLLACNFDRSSSPERTSSSNQRSCGKHDLTPKSKSSGLPQRKRIHVAGPSSAQCNLENIYQEGGEIGRDTLQLDKERVLSGIERKKRQELLQSKLSEGFEECEGKEVDQNLILQFLELRDEKSLATRVVTSIFPSCEIKRIQRKGQIYNVYNNITRKSAHVPLYDGNLSGIDTEIERMQKQISDCELHMEELWSILTTHLENNVPGDASLKVAEQYKVEQGNKDTYLNALVKLYQAQVQNIQNYGLYLNVEQQQALDMEMKKLEELSDRGYRAGKFWTDTDIPNNMFVSFLDEIIEHCPLVASVIECLVVSNKRERNIHKTATYKMLCASQSLSVLLNIRNSRAMNDFVLFFGMLCISFGAGKQFINMLSSLGLTLHWDTLMNYLDKRLDNFQEIIEDKFPTQNPVILLIDNINLYRGRNRHDRLLKKFGPKMWNFTARAALVPNLHGISDLFHDSAKYIDPQGSIADIKAKDILLDGDVEHLKLWNNMKDRYFLNLLDVGLNNVPSSPKPIAELSERECIAWIKQSMTQTTTTSQQYEIEVKREFPLLGKSDYLILPLSLENNSTLTGTASIFEQFGREFHIPCEHATSYFAYNKDEKLYDISAARKHHEFMVMLFNHRANMFAMDQQIRSTEKSIDGSEIAPESGDDGETETVGLQTETLESTNKYFQQQDGKLTKLYNSVNNQMLNAMQSQESGMLKQCVNKLHDTREDWENITDHLGRNILHDAVENGNIPLVKTLLSAGVNINVQEGCGATPLSIAVLNKNIVMCDLLTHNFASFSGPLFANMPSPIEMAETMELNDIMSLFEPQSIEDEDISTIIDSNSIAHHNMEPDDTDDGQGDDTLTVMYNRTLHVQFPTAIVGDQGTCKTTRSTKNRSQAAFKWAAEIPGDLHTKGYICEAAFKAQKTGVFHFMVNKVMKRPKVTEEAFKSRKFQQQNLSRIQEAVRDGGMALGLAAVHNFQKSLQFPSKEKLDEHLQLFGNHNDLILELFKDWLSTCAAKDPSFAYNMQLVVLFGPLLKTANVVIRNGLGSTREALWKLLLPVFAQLQFRNYWTESLVHVINFTTVWPVAFREMMKRNCSISLSAKEGHDLAMDEFVEEHLVKPLKAYVSGHTSVKTCERIMANVQIIEAIRKIFMSRQGFDVHPTTKHKEQDPFLDQLKGMWFCLKENVVSCVEGRKVVKLFPWDGSTSREVALPKAYCDVYKKGCDKVEKEFDRKVHECFPSARSIGSD